jgi:hypothetical protein
MNKQTTTILGVGALAIVGYLVYKQMSKPKTFANFSPSMMPLSRCRKSPSQAAIGTDNAGRKLYECCSPGVTAYAPSKQKCDTQGGTTVLTDSTGVGRNF